MNKEQAKKLSEFLLPNEELKNREELREILEKETSEELKKYLPLNQDSEY